MGFMGIVILLSSSCQEAADKTYDYEQDSVGTLTEAIDAMENHKERQGIKIVNHLIKDSSDSLSYLYFVKAMGFYKLKEFDLSMIAIDKSIDFDTLNYRSYAVKGDIFQKTNEFDSALLYYNKAVVGLPRDQFLLNNIGTLYSTKKKYREARDVFQRLDSIVPMNADYLFNLSFTYYKLKSYDTAYLYVERGILWRDDDAGLYNLRGQILAKKGKIEESIESFEKSIRLKPEDNVAVENLRRVKKLDR